MTQLETEDIFHLLHGTVLEKYSTKLPRKLALPNGYPKKNWNGTEVKATELVSSLPQSLRWLKQWAKCLEWMLSTGAAQRFEKAS